MLLEYNIFNVTGTLRLRTQIPPKNKSTEPNCMVATVTHNARHFWVPISPNVTHNAASVATKNVVQKWKFLPKAILMQKKLGTFKIGRSSQQLRAASQRIRSWPKISESARSIVTPRR